MAMRRLRRDAAWAVVVGLGLLIYGNAHAASFDCAKAQSGVEQLVCGNPKLSQLDDALSESYKIALQDKATAGQVRKEQRRWLKDLGTCPNAECVEWSYTGRTIELQNLNARTALTRLQSQNKAEQDRKAGYKGEYILSQSDDLMCLPFTQNLNEFRTLDFDECHPRLSEKFPEFSRPEWKEVPLDLDVAEKAFKDSAGEKLKPGEGTYWKNWLDETAELRAAGQVKMWLTQIDINHDGILDPIARVQYAHPASSWPVKQRGCVFTHSGLRFLSKPPINLFGPFKHFYFSSDTDIIHSSKTGYTYSVDWSELAAGPNLDGQKIGATRGVIVELSREAHSSPVPVCYINWVPTGSYRPLQTPLHNKQLSQ